MSGEPKIPCTCGPDHPVGDTCPYQDQCYEEWIYTRFAGHIQASSPNRIQLKRRKGWQKPPDAIVVARPTKWGNPFTIKDAIESGFAHDKDEAQTLVVQAFADWLQKGPQSPWWFEAGKERWSQIVGNIRSLRGHDLACWCRHDQECHADVLLEMSNR